MRVVFLCCWLLFGSTVLQAQGEGDRSREEESSPNEIFVTAALTSVAESFFKKSLIKAADSLIIDVRSFVPVSGTENITRSIFQKVALQHTLRVLPPSSQLAEAKAKHRLEIEILGWDFNASKRKTDTYEQAFRSFFLLRLQDKQGGVIFADTLLAERSRILKTTDDLDAVQASVPAFRHQLTRSLWSRTDFIESLLITLAAATTVFLLYRIRSQ